jgi:hypothetical protein
MASCRNRESWGVTSCLERYTACEHDLLLEGGAMDGPANTRKRAVPHDGHGPAPCLSSDPEGEARRILIFFRHAVGLAVRGIATAVHLDCGDLATVDVIQFRVRQNA